MLIDCPCCGRRGSEEFVYRGDATVRRPDLGLCATTASGTPSEWMDYVYWRANPSGRHREFWYHATGCRAWLVVTRNVTTHEIITVEPAKKSAGGDQAGTA